jgi:glycosyltransferase involved in cell wall biosynthesis
MAAHRGNGRRMTTVTAIVPTYNRADTLARALASVFAQRRAPDEVLIVDDGSLDADATAAVVARFPAARRIRLEQNGGAGRARNAGVRQAKGELIAFLDSDDAWRPDKLARQLAELRDAELLCTGITVHERSGRVTDYPGSPPRSAAGWSFADFQAYPFAPTTWLIRRRVLDEAGGFDESLRNCEDLDLLARLAHRRIRVLPDVLAVKHNRADSLDAALARTADSYQILLQRHAAIWARAPAAAARGCCRVAHMHVDAGELAQARRALLRGLRHAPADLRSWGLLAASAFGVRGVHALRRLAREP